MKKNIFNLLMLVVFILAVSSCDKKYETADISTITYYPEFTYSGEAIVIFNLGETFVDPGIVAIENGVQIPVTMDVTGVYTGFSGTEVKMTAADKYLITYTATNSDGYSANQYREVWVVGDEALTAGIGGLYTSTVFRGAAPGTPSAQYTDLEWILIYKISGNTYGISCALGGYYALGRVYGDDYSFKGATITVVDLAANNFTYTQAVAPAWGNTADITEFVVDAANSKITFKATGNFSNSVFWVTLNKVSL